MKNTRNEIEQLLFKTNGLVNFNLEKYIEVQPGIFSPILVNIKITLGDLKVRNKLAEELAKRVSPESICICGIESGGSYYASAVANILKKPLVLFRKEEKKYGLMGRFVGSIPSVKNGLVTMVDDVLAGGMISTANNKALTEMGYCSEFVVIYSYLPKLFGPMSKVKISALSDINGLCQVGLERGIFTENNVKIIKRECAWSNKGAP